MKKFLVVCAAAMLCCSLASAQEAEDTGRGAVLSIIPRLDAGVLTIAGGGAQFSFGNTSLYTLFEGNITPWLGFTLSNHWAQTDAWAGIPGDAFAATADLYHLNIPGTANAYNFIDLAYLTFTPGNWTFTLGKQTLLMGGWEADDYDWDVNPLLASELWNTYNSYQWGLTAEWALPRNIGSIALQGAVNVYGLGPAVGLGWNGTYGPYQMKWSLLWTPTPWSSTQYELLASLGNRLSFGDLTIDLDYFSACGDVNAFSEPGLILYPSIYGNTVLGRLNYVCSDQFEIGLKAIWNGVVPTYPYGWSSSDGTPVIPQAILDEGGDATDIAGLATLTAGLSGAWYPIPDNSDLRVQFALGMNNYSFDAGAGQFFATLGVTYNFGINLW